MDPTPPQETTVPGSAFTDADTLNSLLRGEIAAVETYDQAIPKFESGPIASELRRIRDEHQQTVGTLRDRVRATGTEPSEGSGPWGVFASVVTGTAKVLGQQAVLSALKQGEEHGINDYQTSFENTDLSAECRSLIGTTLLPRCHQHVAALDRLIDSLQAE
jgi:hypothetical protein